MHSCLPIRAVLFDLGSTLIYFDAPWPGAFHEMADALTEELRKFGIDSLDRESFDRELYQHIILNEPRAEDNYRQVTAAENLSKVLTTFGYNLSTSDHLKPALRKMFEVAERYWTVEEDALPLLEKLKQAGYKLAIISNAEDEEDIQHILRKTGFADKFDVILNSASYGFAKPGANIFHEALRQLAVKPEECVMVGDLLDKDILGANRLGIRSVWITRRSRHANREISEPETTPWRTIQTLAELKPIIGV
jgi:HAD superfamily phosphatase (TIGR01668 family)